MAGGVMLFDTTVISPQDSAARRIWLATQDITSKDYKAAKTRLGKAKKSLQDVVQSGNKSLHEVPRT